MNAPLDKRLNELALRAAYGGAAFTKFLEPSALDDARAAANRAGVRAAFWGGYDDAERVVAGFYADDDAPAPEDFPVAALRIEWNERFAHPGHRDLLGAAMGLGVERETLGDVALGKLGDSPCAWLFCLPDVADYVCMNFESAGRAAVKVRVETGEPAVLPPEGAAARVTVQQPRLDAVLAAACRLSRSKAQKLIAAGLVKLNHAPNLRGDAKLAPGDLISARGYGRIRVDAFEGESRRGRQIVQLFIYGRR